MSIRTILSKKLVAVCPVCKMHIYGGMLDFQSIDISQVHNFPFPYEFSHSNHDNLKDHLETHKITLYFDANLSVRDIESTKPNQ